jgi:SAM-dependent methyltransferase
MTPEAYVAYWREHWAALGGADKPTASGRTSYSPEDTEALCADAVAALDLKQSDILLDIGCAKGLMSEGLKRKAMAYYGLDYIKAFRPDVLGTAIELPFRDEAFDKVLLSGVLVCIPPEWHRRVLLEIRRVTRLGGRAFISANPFVKIHEMAHVFDIAALQHLAASCGWSEVFERPIDARLEQAAYYFDLVLIR